MCGRFETKKIERSLIELFKENKLEVDIDPEIEKRSTEDIRPTEKIISVLLKDSIYKITKVAWGIKYSDDSPLIFNSRIETIKEKKYWTTMFERYKCIVPMTGFYEWKKESKGKTKYKILLPDQNIFFVPAIYHLDKDKQIHASLITTTPNKFIEKIHHRMPVIFDFNDAIKYLNEDVEKNFKRCVPYNNKMPMEMEIA